MINLVTNKQLDIILNNTNKALAEVIKTASPLELKNISQNIAESKDLNSIIDTLLKQTATDSSSDKALLNLVKNNPTLKNLGPIGDTVKELLVTLKADDKALPIQTKLKSFLVDIKDVTQPVLKKRIENSGVFLESKLKNAQNPQVELKNVLESLNKTLDKSKIFNVTVLSENIKELLSTKPLLKTSNKALTQTPVSDKNSLLEKKAILEVVKKLETILPKLTEHIKSMDAINKPNFTKTLSKLEHLIDANITPKENFSLPKIKEALTQLTAQLSQSKLPESKDLNSIISTLLKPTATDSSSDKPILEVVKKLETILPKLTEHIKNIDNLNKQNITTTLSKLKDLVKPKIVQKENFSLPKIQEALTQLTAQLPQSKLPESKSILDSLVKVLTLLKTNPSLDTIIEKKVPQEIKTNVENLKDIIKKADPIFSKEVTSHVQKLAQITSPHQLQTQHNVKEIINSDFKAILHQAKDEITKSDHPSKQEIVKQIDKLTLQIDYSQLVSHLSNASSLYIPFAWDEMKEGHINIHKDSQDKFLVDIDLKLKEYGALNLKLTLFDKNQLNLHIYSNSAKLKEMIRENLPALRSALIDKSITPREMRLYDIKEKKAPSPYESNSDNIKMGFEVIG